MDPVTAIGLVASITQLIGVIAKTIGYLNDVKDAPKDRSRLIHEASRLLALLTDLNYTLESADTMELWLGTVRSQGMKDVLDLLQRSMEELAKKIKPEHGIKGLGKRLLWTLDKKEILEILAKIERVKSLVGMALQRDHIQLSLAINVVMSPSPSLW
ncbi:hypothetical protein LPUS_02266 [Lasallia pustulata]|uniref:Fungal N-terminal domain-containing protein n=1 Tax=Lasallia pustulata TaxID=136370 RepID=A0A1W5CSC1_9LECA|nr:hypothetical protein LPUS_02266 [Lasallia pustulata]